MATDDPWHDRSRPGAGGRLAHEHHGVAHGVVALSRSGVDGRGIDLGSRIPAGKKSRRSEPRPHLLLSGRHDLRLAGTLDRAPDSPTVRLLGNTSGDETHGGVAACPEKRPQHTGERLRHRFSMYSGGGWKR